MTIPEYYDFDHHLIGHSEWKISALLSDVTWENGVIESLKASENVQ